MRTIKFRAKRLGTHEWVYGCLFQTPVGEWKIKKGFREYLVNPDTVCQFTGLRDIKGTEIYDGDILDTKTSDYVPNGYSFICKWIDSGFALIYQGRTYGSKEKNNWLNKYPLCQKNVEDLIIMGNIFDNPELVKQDPNENE